MNALRRFWEWFTKCGTYTLTEEDLRCLQEMTPEQRSGWFTAIYLGFGRPEQYDKDQS